MSEMFNPAVIGGEYATGITDGIDSGAVDLEAQLIALQSQTSDNERRRELLLKLAGWAFTASSAALFSVLSANLREMKGRIRVLFTACTASLVGAHLCSGVIIAMLLLLKRYFACLACALEVMCYVASGLMVISGFLAFALLQYLSIQKGVT